MVDIGSGVTFFPFSVARLGYRVLATDIDPICEIDFPKAIELVDTNPGEISFRRSTPERLAFEDQEVDAAYCISMLSHTPDPSARIREIARILRPGGLFVLSFVLDLLGWQRISVESHRQLLATVRDYFDFVHPEKTVHPMDMLTSRRSTYPLRRPLDASGIRFLIKQWLIKPLFLRKPRSWEWFYLSNQGSVLRRKNS